MRPSVTRTGARRRGDDYQDIVALDLVVTMMEHPERYHWIRVEATEMGSLDDVVAFRRDGRYLCRQVKYANFPDDPKEALSWAMLLERESGAKGPKRSLLMKWADSLNQIRGLGDILEASVVTNRPAAPEVLITFGREPGKLDYDKIIDEEIKKAIAEQLGGEDHAREFFASFSFWLDKPDLPNLEQAVITRFKALGFDNPDWLSLKDAMRFWVRERDHAPPAGEITYEIARRAAGWRQLRPLPQEFEITPDYVLPSKLFHEEFLSLIESGSGRCFMLTGPPGSGKSTYLSYVARDLRDRFVPVIRHHYFLSTHYRGDDRITHQRVAESLMSELETYYPDALGRFIAKNPLPDHLGQWLDSCGRHFDAQKKILVVIIDGLDHVLRDRGSFDEVRDLLHHLLPGREGVVVILGTQPLDMSLFPQKTRQHVAPENFFELPALDVVAIQEWVETHAEELGVNSRLRGYEQDIARNLPENQRLELVQQERYSQTRSLAREFLSISEGHALYLQYALFHLLESKAPITAEVVRRLPAIPHRDIHAYYRELWEGLSEGGRSILHLFAACKFDWPKNAIIDALSGELLSRQDLVKGLREIAHLIVESELGVRPFHNSLVVFVETLEDHASYRTFAQRLALNWLQSDSAPNYLRWSNLWTLQAKLGDTAPSLSGPCREWAIDAILKRYDAGEILRKLATACSASVDACDPLNYIRVALLRDYVDQVFEASEEALDMLLEPLLILQLDPWLDKRLEYDLRYLSPIELVSLSRYASSHGQTESIHAVLDELDRRRRARDVSYDNYTSYTEAEVVCLAHLPDYPPKDVADFITVHRSQGISVHLTDIYCRELRRFRNIRGFRGILPIPLQYEEKCAAHQHAVLLALEERINLKELTVDGNYVNPFAATLLQLQQSEKLLDHETVFPHLDYRKRQRTSVYMSWSSESANMADTFYEAFACFLANCLRDKSEMNRAWLKEVGTASYDRRFFWALEKLSEAVAQSVTEGRTVGFEELFEILGSSLGAGPSASRDSWEIVEAVPMAATRIVFDTICLSIFASGNYPSISEADLATALRSGFCSLYQLTKYYLLLDRRWLSENAVSWLFREYAATLDDPEDIYTFPERAADYAKMATLAARHGRRDDAENYLGEAAKNLLGYGYHKDIFLRDILKTAVFCYQAGITEARSWILDLVPAIVKVEDFTDGDMTRYLGESLAETLAEIDPELLVAYHEWLLRHEDYWTADKAFEAFLKKADLSSPIVKAIAATVLDKESLAIIQSRTRHMDVTEEITPSGPIREDKATSDVVLPRVSGHELRHKPSEKAQQSPSPADYPPKEFLDYLRQLSIGEGHRYWKHVSIDEWLTYWIEAGHVDSAFEAMNAAFSSGVRFRVSDEVFEAALDFLGAERAFTWLVRAHACDDGWKRDWERSRGGNVLARWETVKSLYADKWLVFMMESIRLEDEERWGDYGKGRFEKMTRYCIFMGELEMASKLMRTVTDFALELVSPMNLTMPDWVPHDEPTI